jgi:hypothetical protein
MVPRLAIYFFAAPYPIPSKLDEINLVAARAVGKPLSFVWINAERQLGLAKSLGFMSKGMYPAALAVNMRRGALAHFVGRFDEASLSDFADRALGGRTRIGKYSGDAPVAVDEADMDVAGEKANDDKAKEDL